VILEEGSNFNCRTHAERILNDTLDFLSFAFFVYMLELLSHCIVLYLLLGCRYQVSLDGVRTQSSLRSVNSSKQKLVGKICNNQFIIPHRVL
jgi:hypothetical protein